MGINRKATRKKGIRGARYDSSYSSKMLISTQKIKANVDTNCE